MKDETIQFIKTAPPEWSASQVMWDVGLQFIDERRDSAEMLRELSADKGWLLFLAVKKHIDERLVEWMRNHLEDLRQRFAPVL